MRKLTMIGLMALLMVSADKAFGSGYSFVASGADYCGMGGFHAAGGGGGVNADGSPNYFWMFQLNPSLPTGGTLSYSWELRDAQGVIASGSYDSTTGSSTGGSGSSGADFYASRAEIGSLDGMSFAAWGNFYCPSCSWGSPCRESFFESTYDTISSGGYFSYHQ